MREKSNFGSMAVILICAIGVGLLVGWLAIKSPKTETPPPPIAEISSNAPAKPTETNVSVAVDPEPTDPVVETNTPPESDEVTAANWNDKLTDLLASDKMDEDEKADKMADMIPKLPEPAQVEIAEHLVNLVADQNYHLKASKIVLSEKMPGTVSSVLFNDLMNRGDDLRLPITLAIAKNENHPLQKEALESLEMTLMEEFGTDWDKWQTAVDESLKTQGLTAQPLPTLEP